MLRTRNRAGVISAEDSVTVARDEIINGIPQRPRQYFENPSQLPDSPNLREDKESGLRFGQQAWRTRAVIRHDVERVEVTGISFKLPKDGVTHLALEGSKVKFSLRISWQNEGVQSIAQGANAIVQDEVAP